MPSLLRNYVAITTELEWATFLGPAAKLATGPKSWKQILLRGTINPSVDKSASLQKAIACLLYAGKDQLLWLGVFDKPC